MPKGEWGMQFGCDCVQSIRHPVLGCVSEFGGFSSERKAPLVGIWKCSRFIFKKYLICELFQTEAICLFSILEYYQPLSLSILSSFFSHNEIPVSYMLEIFNLSSMSINIFVTFSISFFALFTN